MTDDIFKYIDVEKTIAKFGYDPRSLGIGSAKKVFVKCHFCDETKETSFRELFRTKLSPNCKKHLSCELEENGLDLKDIDLEKTEKELGYNPKFLKKNSTKKVFVICPKCKNIRQATFNNLNKKQKQKTCVKCCNLNREVSEKTRRLLSEKTSLLMTDENKKILSEKAKGRKVSKETREKQSKIHKGKKFSIETRKKISQAIKTIVKTRKTIHGYGYWYLKTDGSKVWMRSTWEVKYARHLDSLCIAWEIEPKSFLVTYESNGEVKESNYWPDFFVNGEWFEVKGYWRDDAKLKFEAFKAQYPDEKITLLMKPELLALGIDIK